MKKAIFTICAKNYIAYARTLLNSAKEMHPEFDVYLVLSDRPEDVFKSEEECWPVISCSDLGIQELSDMAFRYNITEFSTAIKPAAFNYFLKENKYEIVMYLDPDIYVIDHFDEVISALENGSDAVVTPHITFPVEDGYKPDDQSMLQAGIYNLGFLGVKNTEQVKSFMDWWHRRLINDCRIDLSEGLFVDQKWADFVPCFIHKTNICHHPGYNIAYWNLIQRTVEVDNNKWFSNGLPVRFFHFSGVESDDANVFSKHQTRFNAKNIGPVKKLLKAYRREVENNGRQNTKNWEYAFNYDNHGNYIPPIIRIFYREYLKKIGSSQQVDPFEFIVHIANEPDPDVVHDDNYPITRIMKKIWDVREDLKSVFNIHDATGREGFINWYMESAESEYKLSVAFIPGSDYRKKLRLTLKKKSALEEYKLNLVKSVLQNVGAFKFIYMRFPQAMRMSIKNKLLRVAYLTKVDLRASAYKGEEKQKVVNCTVTPKKGVSLIGYPLAELGMGEHVRQSALACDVADVPHSIYDFNVNIISRQNDLRLKERVSSDLSHCVNIFHINADQMLIALDSIGQSGFEGKYNIGYWAWELSNFPDEWLPAVDLVDEIWAPSKFIKEALEKKVSKPITHMPLAVNMPDSGMRYGRDHYGIREDSYVFLFYFDFSSFSTRKNPFAVLNAFREAFPIGTVNVSLVVKTMSNHCHEKEVKTLNESVKDDDRIVVINRVMDHDEMIDLVRVSDCFVSMHRSEGFGRGMAEAMYYGKPVIATNYSGNTDFMNVRNSILLDYKLIPVNDSEYPFGKGNYWAEPSHEQAVAHMRKLFDNPEYGRKIGELAKTEIRKTNSLERVGSLYRARLEELGLI